MTFRWQRGRAALEVLGGRCRSCGQHYCPYPTIWGSVTGPSLRGWTCSPRPGLNPGVGTLVFGGCSVPHCGPLLWPPSIHMHTSSYTQNTITSTPKKKPPNRSSFASSSCVRIRLYPVRPIGSLNGSLWSGSLYSTRCFSASSCFFHERPYVNPIS